MDNTRLAQLELALKRERQTMKRQELLRDIWRVYRSAQPESSVSGQLNPAMFPQRKKVKAHTNPLSPARGASELHAESTSVAG
jgi:hypothetical protein